MKKFYLLYLFIMIGILKLYPQANPTNVFQHWIFYHTEDQSMWSQGDGFSFDMDYDLIPTQGQGVSENFNNSFGDGTFVDVSYNFGVHFRSTFSIHGFTLGTIDQLDYPVIITLDYPDHYSFDHGQPIDILTSYTIHPMYKLTPIFPSAGIVSLDLEYGINLGFDIEMLGVDAGGFNITIPTNASLVDPNGVLYDSIAIFYINAITGEVAYPCLNQYNLPTICHDDLLPISIPDWFGIGLTGEINIPHIDNYSTYTSGSCGSYCLVSEGSDQWAWFNLDVLDFMQFFIQFIPGYGEAINTVIDILQGDVDFIAEYLPFVSDYLCLDYYILNIDIYMASTLHQEFKFCPTIEAKFKFPTPLEYWEINPNTGGNIVETGVSDVITIDVCNTLRIKYPCYGWDSMQVLSVHYHLIPTFSNHTWNRFDFTLIFQMLYFHFCIDIPLMKSPSQPLPEFSLPLANNETVSSTPLVINDIDLNQYKTNTKGEFSGTPPNNNLTRNACDDCDWNYTIGPLIDISQPLGGFDLPLYQNTWLIGLNGNSLNSNGEWVSTDWAWADTTLPGTWLYPRPELGITTSFEDVICYGDTTGKLIVTASPSTTGPYTYSYSWEPTTHITNSTTDILYVPAGSYTVTLTDHWGCSKSASFTIVDLFPEIILTLDKDDAICYGTATGNLYSEVSGGAPPYTWNWQPGNLTTQNPTGVYAATYNVTVTDSQGCTKKGTIIVGQPPQNIITPTVTNVTCYGFVNGEISITVTGGTAPYNYQWSNGANTSNISGLAAGTYSVTVTDSQGCISTMDIIVSQPNELLLTTSKTDVLCHGESTGAINLTILGGTQPYDVSWSNGAITEDIMAIPAGTYSVTVIDANGCSDNVTIIITEPPTAMTSSAIPTDNICFGAAEGAADLSVEGGIPPYSFSWSNGATTEDIYNLVSGTYTVTITDANGCILIGTVFVGQPPQIVVTPNIQHISCYGMNDGYISIFVNGGTPPYDYLWNNGNSSTLLSGLSAGTYSLTITDAVNCTLSKTYTIIEPALLEVSDAVATDVLCYGDNTGAINITVIGGTMPYSFSWNNGQITEDLSDLYAGNYSVTVTDNSGCAAYRSVQITQPLAKINISAIIHHVSCYEGSDGSIDISVSGGTQPFTYLWNPYAITQDLVDIVSGTYIVSVTDSHGCNETLEVFVSQPSLIEMTGNVSNVSCKGLSDGSITISVSGGVLPYQYHWSNSSITTNLINVSAGSYTLTVTDAHNCESIHTYVVSEPQQLTLTTNITHVLCYGQSVGAVDLSVSGGTLPYSYLWNNGLTSEDIVNTSAGTYYVTVIDSKGCVASIEANIIQPELPLTAVITPHSVTCFAEGDGIADLNVSGGTAPYYYFWNTGAISEDIENLNPGLYIVTITDSHYCIVVVQAQITQASSPMKGTISGSHVKCNGDASGNVYTTMIGGIPPYHYAWSTGSWEQNLLNVSAGTYYVTVTDANFCKVYMSFTVKEPDPYKIYTFPVTTICSGTTTEIGLALISGNTPTYTVNWNTGANGIKINVTPFETTTYTAIVTDAYGCSSSPINITVPVSEAPEIDVTTFNDIVCSGETVDFFVNVIYGNTAGDHIYINGIKTPITIPIRIPIFNDSTFVFSIPNACNSEQISVTKNIKVSPNPTIIAGSDKIAGCSPLKVTFYENSFDSGQKYLWNFDDGDFENLSTEKYPIHTFNSSKTFKVHLTVESKFGCKSETIIPIFVYPIPVAAFVVNSNVLDIEDPRAEFYDLSENPEYYYWDFGDSTTSDMKHPIHRYTEVGNYTVILKITTMYGCIDTTKMNIQVNYSNLFYAPTAFTPNNDEINDKFKVFVTNYEQNSFEMKILDRWGEVIFKSNDPEKGWDGQIDKRTFQAGVYTWIVKYRDMNGEEITKTGNVTLIK